MESARETTEGLGGFGARLRGIESIIKQAMQQHSNLTLNFNFYDGASIGQHIERTDTSNMWMMPGVDSLDWSNRVRLLSIYQTILAFLHRPLFGYGVGAVCCHGATAMMLAGCGIVGVYYWAKFYFFSRTIQTKFHPNKKGYLISILVFLFVTVFYSNGVKAFYELSAIMLVICFSVIFTQRKKCVSYFL